MYLNMNILLPIKYNNKCKVIPKLITVRLRPLPPYPLVRQLHVNRNDGFIHRKLQLKHF